MKKFTDEELLIAIARHLEENHITWSEMADELGIARENLSRWRAGRKISPRVKKMLIGWLMPGIVASEEKENCEDMFFAIVSESWQYLSTQQRAEIAGIAKTYADIKLSDGRAEISEKSS